MKATAENAGSAEKDDGGFLLGGLRELRG